MVRLGIAGAILALGTALVAYVSIQVDPEGLATTAKTLSGSVLVGLLMLTVALGLAQGARQRLVPARIPVRHGERPDAEVIRLDDERLWRT